MTSSSGPERKIPKYKYLSREEIIGAALMGKLHEEELRQAAPIAFNFPTCRFKRARMVKNEFIEAWEKLPDTTLQQKEQKIRVSTS